MRFCTFVSIFVYSSFIFSFATYMTFYNISEILSSSLKRSEDYYDIELVRQIVSIASHSLQCIFGIIFLTYFKDIFYSIATSYLLIGYLISKEIHLDDERISAIVLLVISVLSVLVTICKYGKSSFGFENDEEYFNNMLQARADIKRSSWFSLQN
jgi:hypothetical protein